MFSELSARFRRSESLPACDATLIARTIVLYQFMIQELLRYIADAAGVVIMWNEANRSSFSSRYYRREPVFCSNVTARAVLF